MRIISSFLLAVLFVFYTNSMFIIYSAVIMLVVHTKNYVRTCQFRRQHGHIIAMLFDTKYGLNINHSKEEGWMWCKARHNLSFSIYLSLSIPLSPSPSLSLSRSSPLSLSLSLSPSLSLSFSHIYHYTYIIQKKRGGCVVKCDITLFLFLSLSLFLSFSLSLFLTNSPSTRNFTR